MRADKTLVTGKEDSLDCTAIYPSRIGTVSSVIEVNKETNFYDFVDSDIPNDLDFKKCLILFFRISDIIRFTESLESGIVAIGFQPETGNLVDPFFHTVFVTVVFGG